jgi:creatinine amidohydrolase
MPGRPWILKEATLDTVGTTDYEVAVLPWGATEPHNFHLPHGTDVYESEAVAAEAGRLAWEKGARTLVLPCVPFGANEQQMDIPGTVNLHPSTQASVLSDIVESVEAWNLPKLMILNGHGGNDFRQMIRELQTQTELFLSVVSWFRIPGTLSGFDDPGDHAGEAETSLMLHLHPELVLPLEEAGSGTARPWKLTAIREGWAWAPRQWSEMTEDTGVGDPAPATSEKGVEYFQIVSERVADYLVELAAADPDDLYG